MRILLYGINFAPELTGTGKYTGELAAWLAARGHEVRVITAPPYYPEWKVRQGYSSWLWRTEQGASLTVLRCPLQQGAVVTVADCAIDFNTANVSAEGGTATVQATVSLNGTVSSPVTTTVVIQSNGDVLVNGTKITSASVTQVTGGS